MAFEDFSVEKLAARKEPARLYLWTIDLVPPGASDVESLTLQARTVSLPGIENNEIVIPYMNSEFYIPAKRTWETLDIGFMENENGIITKTFYDWSNRIYNVEGYGEGGYQSDYKSRLDITPLTVKGEEIAQWIVYGCWPKTITAIDLDYESDAPMIVTVTFRFDYWIRNPVIGKISETGLPVSGQLNIPGVGGIYI